MTRVSKWLRSARLNAGSSRCRFIVFEPGVSLHLDLTDGESLEIGHSWIYYPLPPPAYGGGKSCGATVSTQSVDIYGSSGRMGTFLAPDLAQFLMREQTRLYSSAASR